MHRALREEGSIHTEPGLGSFVSEKPPTPPAEDADGSWSNPPPCTRLPGP
ncbi:hypothetical protein ACFWIY_04930 [Streptomyces sioyaensis]